jgi:lipopolysaccharide/colanic/teichoic acid biosynthesis glycosyltransferase
LLFSKFFHVYDVGHKLLLDIIFGHFLTISLSNIFTYLQLSMIKNWPYFYSVKVLGVITIVNFCIATIGSIILNFIYFQLTPIKDAILITSNDKQLQLDLAENKLDKRFVIKKIINIEIGEEKIKEEISNYKIVVIDDIPPYLRNNLLKYCYEFEKKCYAKPKLSDILIRSANITKLCYNSMMIYDAKKITLWQAFFKRLFDIVASLCGLILLFPLFILIAILIKLTDKGPIFFIQERYTKDKKPFKIYKFRSMYVQKDNKLQMTTKNDARITPIGVLLRRSHFDELPQLFNILKGDMSIVGPRPEMLELYDLYCEKYPEFRYRLKMKAALTGYAQVYGKYNTNPYDKLKFDLLYICNFSLLLDIKLMLLTVKILFMKDTSEGIDDNKTNALKDD